MKINTFKSQKSFTLIEMVMVIVIVGILMGASSMYIKETIDLWRFLNFRNEVTAQGRMAFERMSREIREVKLRTQSYEPIQSAAANSFRFISVIEGTDTDVTFSLSAGNLQRTVASANVLASNVSSLQFCYYNKPGDPAPCAPACSCTVAAADLSRIYRVVIKMDVTSGGQVKHLETQVYPRNLH